MLASAGGFEVRQALADDAAQSATHTQERLIKVVDGNSREKLTTFAVDRQGRIIAGVTGEKSLLRVFNSEGDHLAEWPLPVPPEAVNVGPKGDVYVGGDGKLLLLDSAGAVMKVCEAPNLAGAKDAAVAIQKKIQERA
jgi:sugar lactone lactonase YvrE